MGVSKLGDLVWVRVQGHPWWPGQVMDPKTVTNEKVLRDKKPDHTLISFFGDDSYGWFPKGRDIVPFSNNYTAKSKQAAAKKDRKFVKACAECKEVLDRRLGKQPTTKHRPHDFLHPGWSDDSGDEEEQLNDLRPLPASADKLNDCSAEQALLWLRTVACTPLERPKMSPVKIDGAKRQLFSLSQSHNIKLQQAPADGETPKAAARRASPPKGVKMEQTSKQQNGGQETNVVGKARPIKRKHKEEAAPKADKEKLKKQRRKPAIADPAKVEPAITDLPDQDQRIDPGSEQLAAALDDEQDLDQGQEQDQDEEEDGEEDQAERVVPKPRKRQAVREEIKEEEDEEPNAMPRQRASRAEGRKLRVQLGEVVGMVQEMAADPQAWQGRPRGSAGAAWLSFRELVYSYSSYNKQETVGECTEVALAGRDVRWVKPRAPREPKERAPVKQTGIPAEEGEDLGIEYRHTHYVSKLPESREAFDKALADFYQEHEATLAPPNIAHVPLDCYFIFNAVAQRGGYEGVSGTRQWSVVAREWRAEMGGGEALRIKKAYKKFLLAFEHHLSQGTTVEERKKKSSRVKRAGGAGGSGSIEPEERPPKPLVKKLVKKRPAKKSVHEDLLAKKRVKAEAAEEEDRAQPDLVDSEPEGSDVSYDSDGGPGPLPEAESEEEDEKRLAAAANPAKLRHLDKQAQRESKVLKRKLQRQRERDMGQEEDYEDKPLRRPRGEWVHESTLRGPDAKSEPEARGLGRRQAVDPRALASRPLRRSEPELSDEAQRLAQERRQRQREQFERNNASSSQAHPERNQPWQRESFRELLSGPTSPIHRQGSGTGSGMGYQRDSGNNRPRSRQYDDFRQRPERQQMHDTNLPGNVLDDNSRNQDAKTLIILKFRETHKLPLRSHVYQVMSQYGKVHIQDDIWFAEPRSVAFVRYKWELDASMAKKKLDGGGADIAFNLPQGSVEKVTQVVPRSKGLGSNRFDRAPGSGPIPGAKPAAGPAHYGQPASGYYPKPTHTPSQQHHGQPQYPSGPASSQPQYASGQIPVQGPTDPRRASAAASVPAANALSSGQIPTRLNSAPGPTGAQYGAGAAGQFAAALPVDPRAQRASALYPAAAPASAGGYRPPPPPSQGRGPPAGGLPPQGGLPPAGYALPSGQQPPHGGLPPASALPGLRPAAYAGRPYQQPQYPPASLPPSQQPARPSPSAQAPLQAAPTHGPPGLSHDDSTAAPAQASALLAGALAPASVSVPAASQAEASSGPGRVESSQDGQSNAAPTDVSALLAMLQNAGLAMPLGGNTAAASGGDATLALKSEVDASSAAGAVGHDSQHPIAAVKADDEKPVKVEDEKAGAPDGAGTADAAPVLAGDGTADIGGNLLALLGQIASAGQ